MFTKTETALRALLAVLTTASQAVDAKISTPLRNEGLPSEFDDAAAGAGLKLYLNLWDGEHEIDDEVIGADDAGIDDGYELLHDARLELAVAGPEQDARDQAFSDALLAIAGAIAADRTLGGAVSYCGIAKLNGQGSGLVTDGLPNVKGCELIIRLSFTSSLPF
jgi:hypothetical protein